jgi:hypothetical protein
MPECTFTVYFEGTSNSLQHYTTQIGLFYAMTQAVDLSVKTPKDTDSQFKIAFDGCGITNGMIGVIFATGLVDQCKVVVSNIERYMLQQFDSITINAIGLSRGGIAVIYLAKMISKLRASKIKMNLLLFDPVPGNLVGPSLFDIFSFSTANQSLDLSSCSNVNSILSLFPYIALPDLAFHAPVLPNYPPGCIVDEDVCLGCHQGALFCLRLTEARLSFVRIHDWLIQHGTSVDINSHAYAPSLAMTHEQCVQAMNHELGALRGLAPAVRSCHSSPAGATIVRRHDPECIYLNKWHRKLMGGDGVDSDVRYLLDIDRPSPWLSLWSSCTSPDSTQRGG